MEYIAFDAHKHYTLASVARPDGRLVREQRLAHERGAFQQFLARCEPGSPVALETVGNWYWIVDEIEGAGCIPKLVHARKAKLMMGQINKTDKLEARGLNTLQRNGTLPTVWIPPGELRDQRELPRTRMALVRQRTTLENRLHATLAKYALHDRQVTGFEHRINSVFKPTRPIQLLTATRSVPIIPRRQVCEANGTPRTRYPSEY